MRLLVHAVVVVVLFAVFAWAVGTDRVHDTIRTGVHAAHWGWDTARSIYDTADDAWHDTRPKGKR